jgi:hypothetical protein
VQLSGVPERRRPLDESVETMKERVVVLEAALRRMRVDATRVAADAIGLFLEYRGMHGCDEEAAVSGAMREVTEGFCAAEEIAAYEAEARRAGITGS